MTSNPSVSFLGGQPGLELERVHARLQDLERHYHALFDRAGVGVAQVEATTGRIGDVNRKCAEIFATSVEALVGSDLADLADPEHRDGLRASLRELGHGDARELVTELAGLRADGQAVRIRLTATPLDQSGHGSAEHVLIIQDITDRWRTEQQLERHRHLLAESQWIAAIGSFRFEYATGAVTWTDEMYRIHGVSPETFQPSIETVLPLIHPEDRTLIVEGRVGDRLSVPFRPAVRYRVVLPDGSIRALSSRGMLVHDRAGAPVAVMGTVQDITELERAIAESRAKTDFLAHMSHEVRTPLSAVLGLSEALLERTFGEINDAQANTLATIYASGRHLLELINDVLDITRVEAGQLRMHTEQALLRPLLDETTAVMYGQLTARGQRMVIELAPALPAVEIDPRRIKQVLLNLLSNASKFSSPGSTVRLLASTNADLGQVEIAVQDEGPGIRPEDLARIFEPFVTLDPTRSRAHDSAGLGLALSKRIVELHGGRLTVASEIGRGSTFTLALPISMIYLGRGAQPAAVPRPATPPQVYPRGRTILLADDDDATVLTLRSYLTNHGYQLRIVRDGPTALEAAQLPDVALVLMDVQLPGLDGLEVTRRLRDRVGRQRPIVALTAHAMPGDEERCLAAGASAYLAKPVSLRSLVALIGNLLQSP